MPALTRDDRRQLLGPAGSCARCRGTKIRHYCRSCDEFFHTCLCSFVTDDRYLTAHDEHRLYLWTPTGVIAQPDFDQP